MMNIRWLYSHWVLVPLLVAATLAVGLMTVLVIRQQQVLRFTQDEGRGEPRLYTRRVLLPTCSQTADSSRRSE